MLVVYVPQNYWDTRQTFSFIVRGSPDLTGPPAKYTPALESLLDALLQGVDAVSRSTGGGAIARELLQRSRDQVLAARERYRADRPDEARALLIEAETNFVEAGNAARRARLQSGEGDTPMA